MKRILSALLICMLLLSVAVVAFADSIATSGRDSVAYGSYKTKASNFSAAPKPTINLSVWTNTGGEMKYWVYYNGNKGGSAAQVTPTYNFISLGNKTVNYMPEKAGQVLADGEHRSTWKTTSKASATGTITVTYAFAETLRIQGAYEEQAAYKSFVQEHPGLDISCEPVQANSSTIEFIEALLTGQFPYDVFTISTNYYDYKHLIAKGFCEDLSQSAYIQDQIALMHPIIQDQVVFDTGVYGVPILVNPEYFCYSPVAWTAAGLDPGDVPSSMEELCDFLEQWNERIESNPEDDICVNYTVNDYSDWLVHLLVGEYIVQCQQANQPVQFESLKFRDLLVRLKNVGEALNRNELYKGDKNLFSYATWNDIAGLAYLIPLRLTADDPVFINTLMNVYCINPQSGNKALAIEFIEHSLTCLDKQEFAKLYVSADGAVESVHYAHNLENWELRQADLSFRLENSKDAEEAGEIEAALDRHAFAREIIENQKYVITVEEVFAYKEKVNSLVFPPPSIFDPSVPDGQLMRGWLAQYLAGSIDENEFINKTNAVAKMIEEESL